MDPQPRHRLLRLAKGGAAILAVAVLARTLSTADFPRVGALVAQRGGWVALGLLPYLVALAVDAVAWRTLLGRGARPPMAGLLRVRLRCDAFGSTLPGGTLIAESIAPTWLRRWIPIEAGVAAVAARKCFVGFAEGLYLLASFAVGFGALHARGAALPWVVLGLAVLMLAMFGGTALALSSGATAARVYSWLASIPIARLRTWVAARSGGFSATDERLTSLFRAPPLRLVAACALFLGAWGLESVETWVLLRLVGVELPFATVFAFEASVSLLRSLACFAPGGLGVQDLGYVAALGALGVPDAVTAGAAFVVLKRAKEVLWALVGYATLLAPGDARQARRALATSAAVLLLALLAGPAWSAGELAAKVGGAPAAAPPVPLFSITKSENRNSVQFAERLDARCAPVGDAPVLEYWRMLERGPAVAEPILALEQPAYGIASQTILERGEDRGLLRVTLRALPRAPLLVESRRGANGACEAVARTAIDGGDARLFNVHVVLRWPFGVARLLVSGWSTADGHVVRDTRAP